MSPGVTESSYIIRGGIEGAERLRILSRVMRPTSMVLLARAGIRRGMTCLDLGCGGGDFALDMARTVGPCGKVVGVDLDSVKLNLARQEAEAQQVSNIEFQSADITVDGLSNTFDLIHARFLLSHVRNPLDVLVRMRSALRPGGIVAVEDVDFQGNFCYPDCSAFRRYVEFYTEAARRRGADANIGPRLPSLLANAGFENVQMNVVQPVGLGGEVKLLAPITMESISGAVLAAGLASQAEVGQVISELYEFARNPGTVCSVPRIVEAWGTIRA